MKTIKLIKLRLYKFTLIILYTTSMLHETWLNREDLSAFQYYVSFSLVITIKTPENSQTRVHIIVYVILECTHFQSRFKEVHVLKMEWAQEDRFLKHWNQHGRCIQLNKERERIKKKSKSKLLKVYTYKYSYQPSINIKRRGV